MDYEMTHCLLELASQRRPFQCGRTRCLDGGGLLEMAQRKYGAIIQTGEPAFFARKAMEVDLSISLICGLLDLQWCCPRTGKKIGMGRDEAWSVMVTRSHFD